MTIRYKIEQYLRERCVSPTRFGREVAGDPRLVFDLRRGREVGARLAARIEAYLQQAGQ